MKTLHQERGVTLFMAMIMLIVLTLLALSTFNVSQSNMQVVSNMQQRDASLHAARSVIEEIVSGVRFSTSKEALLAQPGCGGTNGVINQRCIDTNGDGRKDVTVKVEEPSCVKVKNIKTATLDLANPDQAACSVGVAQTMGTVGSDNGNSLCADSIWEVQAEATDDLSEATVSVTQGIAVMTDIDSVKTSCL